MNRKIFISLTFILFSLNLIAKDLDSNVEYQQLLAKHLEKGHLNAEEYKKQRLQLAKDQKWNKQLSKKVRGVASTLDADKEKIELKNPPIEITVK